MIIKPVHMQRGRNKAESRIKCIPSKCENMSDGIEHYKHTAIIYLKTFIIIY